MVLYIGYACECIQCCIDFSSLLRKRKHLFTGLVQASRFQMGRLPNCVVVQEGLVGVNSAGWISGSVPPAFLHTFRFFIRPSCISKHLPIIPLFFLHSTTPSHSLFPSALPTLSHQPHPLFSYPFHFSILIDCALLQHPPSLFLPLSLTPDESLLAVISDLPTCI